MLVKMTYYILIVALFHVSCLVYGRPKRDSHCQPSDEHIRKYGIRVSSSNETHPFAIVKPLEEDVIVPSTFDDQSKYSSCSLPSVISSDAPLRERVVCPWDWHVNYNPMRLPKALLEARCKCDKIKEVIKNGSQEPMHRVLECELVYFDVKVLEFNQDCSEYQESAEQIALACVAVNQNGNRMIIGDMVTDPVSPEI